MEATPTLAGGMVLIGSNDHYLYALDASSGAFRWKFPAGGNVTGKPIVVSGVAYFGAQNHNVYAVNVSDGSQRWAISVGASVGTVAVANGTVYVGADGVYKLSAAGGGQLAHFPNPIGTQPVSDAAVGNGLIYIATNDAGQRAIFALDETTGATRWRYPTVSNNATLSAPVVDGGLVFATSQDKNVYALDALTGAKVWNFTTGDQFFNPPAIANGVVYAGSYDTFLYALRESDGFSFWSFQSENNIYPSPTYAGGSVYFANSSFIVTSVNAANGGLNWKFDLPFAAFVFGSLAVGP